MEQLLSRNKCHSCESWSIHSADLESKPIIIKCTACGAQHAATNSVSSYISLVKKTEKGVKLLESGFPQLKELVNPGDSVKFEH